MPAEQENYYSGTSGLLLPVPNKEFFPESFKSKTRLSYYGSLFNSIEINSSFYKVPMAATIAKWAAEVPQDFKFTFKLWRGITHNKGLTFNKDDVRDFMNRISNAGLKKGCLLVQFPASIKSLYHKELQDLLSQIRAADPKNEWKTAIEFRHQSWYHSGTWDMLRQYQMGLVLHDMFPAGNNVAHVFTDFVYVRFHGPEGDYKGSYENDFLYEYASYIREWLLEGKQVFTYFNNTIGNAIGNLETLRKLVS